MANIYSVEQLSEHISETPEGFLLCENVPITRAGELIYAPSETPITAGDGNTIIEKSREDIARPETIASFEGKPITINHPHDFVTPENWKALTVGVVQNVRVSKLEDGTDALVADLLITDAQAIARVKNKELREVSCGYEATYVEIAPGRGRQEDIIGNHVALVVSGRCGPDCAIHDHAPRKEPRMIERLKTALAKTLDQVFDSVDAEDQAALLKKLMSRMDSYESRLAVNDSSEESAKAGADQAADPMAMFEERLARLEEAIAQLMASKEDEPSTDLEITTDSCDDVDTIARAEILSPGIAKTGDVKSKALNACYATNEGRQIIDTLLKGKAFDSADKDMLFIAASELVKGERRSQLTRVIHPETESKDVYAEFWKGRK